MKNELKKFLTLGAALAGSSLMVSCDGDNGAPGAPGLAGTTTVITGNASKEVRAPNSNEFSAADIKLTIESDASNALRLGEELSIDLDSILQASGILFGDATQSNGGTIGFAANNSTSNAQILNVTTTGDDATPGTTFSFGSIAYDGDDSRLQPLAIASTNFLLVNNNAPDGNVLTFDKPLLNNVNFTVTGSQGLTLVGTFEAAANVAAVATTTGSGVNNPLPANLTGQTTVGAKAITVVELNATGNSVTLNAGPLSYNLANDEVLVRQSDGTVCIFKQADLTGYAGAPGAFDNTADAVTFNAALNGNLAGAPTVVTNTGTIVAPTAGNPVCYTFVTTNNSAITGSFRFDCDPSVGQQESAIGVSSGNN